MTSVYVLRVPGPVASAAPLLVRGKVEVAAMSATGGLSLIVISTTCSYQQTPINCSVSASLSESDYVAQELPNSVRPFAVRARCVSQRLLLQREIFFNVNVIVIPLP